MDAQLQCGSGFSVWPTERSTSRSQQPTLIGNNKPKVGVRRKDDGDESDEGNGANNVNTNDTSELIQKGSKNIPLVNDNEKADSDINNVIFNYSKVTLTDAMKSILNKGLNFAILPQEIDLTQVIVDHKRFQRSMIWKEYWFDKDTVAKPTPPIFKLKKYNLPKSNKVPEGLKYYFGAIKSEILDPKSKNKVECNVTSQENKALKELVKL